MTPEHLQWLNGLRGTFDVNPVQAILVARMEYQKIDAEVLELLALDAQLLEDQRRREEWVNNAMSMLGGTQLATPAAAAHQAQLFATVMGVIRLADGDPPVAPAVRERALDIIAGRVSLDDQLAILEAAGRESGYGRVASLETAKKLAGPLWHVFVRMLVPQLISRFAALGLPRPQLMELFGVKGDVPKSSSAEEQESINHARARYREEMARAEVDSAARPSESVRHFLNAASSARVTPETEDEQAALAGLCQLLMHSPPPPEELKVILAGVAPWIRSAEQRVTVGQILAVLSAHVLIASELAKKEYIAEKLSAFSEALAEAISEFVSAGPLPALMRGLLYQQGIMLWRLLGKGKSAWALLHDLERQGFKKEQAASIAVIKASLLADDGAPDQACELLKEAWKSNLPMDANQRGWLLKNLLEHCKHAPEAELDLWRSQLAQAASM